MTPTVGNLCFCLWKKYSGLVLNRLMGFHSCKPHQCCYG